MPEPTCDGGRSRDGEGARESAGADAGLVGTDHDASWFFFRAQAESKRRFSRTISDDRVRQKNVFRDTKVPPQETRATPHTPTRLNVLFRELPSRTLSLRVHHRSLEACRRAFPVPTPERVSRDARAFVGNLRRLRKKRSPRSRRLAMSQDSPEQQMPLALSPTALAQRDANMIPTEYPKSIGKKTLDARYARDARRLGRNSDDDAMTRTAAVSDLSFFFVADDDEATPLELTFPRRTLRLSPRRFRSPTDSNMSPASKFVNAKKGGKRSSHGCVRARAIVPRPTRRRLAFTKLRKKTDMSPFRLADACPRSWRATSGVRRR